MNPWVALACLLAAQLLWLLFTRWLGTRGVKPEMSRKAFHSGQGALLLTMPLLFGGEIGPVLVWGALSLTALAVMLLSPGLRQRAAGNVYAVGRISYGDLYFVIGVVLLFFFASSTYYTYAVPLTMLSFADATSALVGKRFGRHKFEAAEGRKSIEGSLAFFAVAFIAAIAWAPTLPKADMLQVVLIAVILGLVVMLLEAISWRGLDNLLIPLGGFLLLRTYLMMDVSLLLINLAVITMLVVFAVAWRRRSTLNHSALITGALFAYTSWTVAGAVWTEGKMGAVGVAWLAPPLLLFLLYNLLIAPRLIEEHHEKHSVDSVLSAMFAGALWLYLAFYLKRPELIWPYCAAFACVTTNMYFERRMTRRLGTVVFLGIATGSAVILLIGLGMLHIIDAENTLALAQQLGVCAAGAVLAALFVRLGVNALLSEETDKRWRWHVRGLAALAGSVVAALPLLGWAVTPA
ncbi:MAG: hypothetical protein M3R04_00455 [bacterium]|nr:hypothetical protein [bacterium]